MASSLIDLDAIFHDWAWKRYSETEWWFRRIKRNNISFEVKWKRCKVIPEEPSYENISRSRHSLVVFQTHYENKTKDDQTNNFRTEKETTSTAVIKVRKGFSRSVEAGIKLPLPKDKKDNKDKKKKGEGQKQAEQPPKGDKKQENDEGQSQAIAEFGNTVEISCDETNTIERKQKWSVDTTITSRKRHVTEAQLVVEEIQSKHAFTMVVRMKGNILVNIRDKNDMTKLVRTIEGDVLTIIQDMIESGSNADSLNIADADPITGWVKWSFAGDLDMKCGITQKVRISAIPIDPDE